MGPPALPALTNDRYGPEQGERICSRLTSGRTVSGSLVVIYDYAAPGIRSSARADERLLPEEHYGFRE